MRGRNYTICDFKNELFYFNPFTVGIQFFLPDETDILEVNFCFTESAVEKMIWINSWFRWAGNFAQVVINGYRNRFLDGKLIMEMREFPIADYAKFFGFERIVPIRLQKVSVVVISEFDAEIMDKDALNDFIGKDCKVIFHCVDQKFIMDKPGLLEANARIIAPCLS